MQNRRDVASSFLMRLGDPGYRLPGENPVNATLEEAQRWVRTYDSLVRFKRELLELCHKYVEHAESDVARVIRETDVVLLEVELSRFQQRHDYWNIRATELAGDGRRGGAD